MHERTTGPEILDAMGGVPIAHFFTAYGTGGTLKGVGEVLRDLAGARVIADIAAWIGGAALPPLPAPTATGFCADVKGR